MTGSETIDVRWKKWLILTAFIRISDGSVFQSGAGDNIVPVWGFCGLNR